MAARRFSELEIPFPAGLSDEVRRAHLVTLGARSLLSRVRELGSGPILVFKGIEAAAAYPAPALRGFVDVDVLVPEPDLFQRQLVAAGFEGVGPTLDWSSLHHLQRLASPDFPCSIEVHRHPKWIPGLTPPSFDELYAGALPSASGVDGILAPAPSAHAVLLAAHAWAERPLRCIGDLLDVALVAELGRPGEADAFASRRGVERVWRTTIAAIERLLADGGRVWPLETWARHLKDARAQSVLESHLERVLAPFCALPTPPALRASGGQLRRTLTPREGESWSDKVARSRSALRDALVDRSRHDRRVRGSARR